jgi:pimeloyl-ACP methyl ester carboxylesterase
MTNRTRLAFGVALTLAALAAAPRTSLAALPPPDVSGATGPASTYGIWLPAEWNGDLLLYVHGFRNPNCGLAIPMTTVCDAGASAAGLTPGDSGTPAGAERVAAWALANGYAVAASSYDATGLALADGALRTMQLRQLFVARVGPPRRVFLFGHSMGGAIVSMLAERHPGLFDGALAACGMIDGSPTQFEYMVDGRALLDAMTRRGIGLPGGVREMPSGLTFYGDVYPALLRYFFVSEPALSWRRVSAWAAMDRVAYPAKSLPELFLGVTEFLYFQALGQPDVLDAAHGVPATNRGTKYLGPPSVPFLAELSFDEIDAAAERVDGDPAALAYAERWYEASGDISFPILTLHTERDAAVPPRHEARFAAKVEAAGRSDLLVQRTSDRAGHCNFAPDEEIAAFRDLVSWVETGVRPAGAP